jgi:hypothetical protein
MVRAGREKGGENLGFVVDFLHLNAGAQTWRGGEEEKNFSAPRLARTKRVTRELGRVAERFSLSDLQASLRL